MSNAKRFQARLGLGEYATAREAGAKACRKGKHLHDCPYKKRGSRFDRLAMAWRDGWQSERNRLAGEAQATV